MAKEGNGSLSRREVSSEKDEDQVPSKRNSGKERDNSDVDSEDERRHGNSSRKRRENSDSDGKYDRKHRKNDRWKRKSRRRYSSEEDSDSSSGSEDDRSEYSGSDSEYSDSESQSSAFEESESEEERKRRKMKERRRKEREEEEKERKRRRKEKERKRRQKEKEEKRKKEKRKMKKEKKKEKKERGKKGAVTNLWGKYGVIRETDMWTKRPEFTAWLAEVKQVNLENLPNWEEKQMFKQFMEDHNTATFPSKKYYNLDAYYRRQIEKEIKKGVKKVRQTERTVFNDEEQRRQELLQVREKHKEEQVLALKHSMQSGMAQAMKEQAQLREEMAYQYKVGNSEAAAAIQRRLDPDAAL